MNREEGTAYAYNRQACLDYNRFLENTMTSFIYVGDLEYIVETNTGGKYIFDSSTGLLRSLVEENEFGTRLQKKMFLRGISRHGLADELGVTYLTICNYINGKSIPSYNVAKQISKILNCSLDDFKYM